MIPLQIVFNFGDSYGTSEVKSFYNQTWFASLFSALVTLSVVGVNYLIQRNTKKKEKEKALEDLEVYFFSMTDYLLDSIQKQIEQFEKLLEQIKVNPYGGYEQSIISGLNLDKIYYLSPTQSYEIFVTSREGRSEEKSQTLVKIYAAFDNIQAVKDLANEIRETFTKNNTESTLAYWDTEYRLKQWKRATRYDIVKANYTALKALGEGLENITAEYSKIQKPTIALANNELFNKYATLINSDASYIASPYWQQFALLNDDAVRYKAKAESAAEALRVHVVGFVKALKEDEGTIREEVEKLRAEKKNTINESN